MKIMMFKNMSLRVGMFSHVVSPNSTLHFYIDFATYFDGFLSSFLVLRQTTVISLLCLHRGHSPLSYSHAAVLHPEFGFGFTLGLSFFVLW